MVNVAGVVQWRKVLGNQLSAGDSILKILVSAKVNKWTMHRKPVGKLGGFHQNAGSNRVRILEIAMLQHDIVVDFVYLHELVDILLMY